jgi:hypothetical protein
MTEKRALIVSCQPEGHKSRRKYYRINYERLQNLPLPLTRARAGCDQVDRFEPIKVTSSLLTQTTTQTKQNDNNTLGVTNTFRASVAAKKSSSSILSLEEAQKHPEWKTYEAWCESPTLKGFNTWLKNPNHPKSNGAAKRRAAALPIAKRNKIINDLNARKQRIMRTFTSADYPKWAEQELAEIQQKLQKL